MSENPSLKDVSIHDLVEELIRRGWEMTWVHGTNPCHGNLELEGPAQDLPHGILGNQAVLLLDEPTEVPK